MLIGAFGLYFFPESPKFLMSQGRNEEALEVLKTIYASNTGNHRDDYPVSKNNIKNTDPHENSQLQWFFLEFSISN